LLKKLLLLPLLSAYLFSTEVILYSECNDKPYSYCERGELKGINIDIYKAIFSKITDYSLSIQKIGWKEGLEKMKNKEIVMLGSLSYHPDARPFISEYTQSFIEKNQALFCNKKSNKLKPNWPKDFHGLKIATIEGFTKDTLFQKAVREGLIEDIEYNENNAFNALMNAEVDCYIGNELSTKGEIVQLLDSEKENNASIEKLQNIEKVLSFESTGRHIGFSFAPFILKTDLIKKINIAIKIMKNSKEIEEIIDKELKSYLNPQQIKIVNASVYNWGEYVSERIPSNGVIAEIVKKAFSNQNIKINYNFVHSNYAYLLTKWGKSCVTFPWVETEEKNGYVYFSKSIKPSSTYLFYKKDIFREGFKYEKFSDLKEYRIGGVKGYFYEKEFEDNNFNYTSYKSLKDAIKALLFNKIDLIPSTKDIFVSDIKKFFPNEIELLSFHKKSFLNVTTHVLFSKKCDDSKALRESFNRGLENIKKNGTFKNILDEHSITLEDFYDYLGNEVDSDNDGVFNEYDECANTQEGVKTDNTGCSTINPYTMDITYNKNQLDIKGYIPSKKEYRKFLSNIKSLYPMLNIIEQLQIENGKIDKWSEFITNIMRPLSKLEKATLKVVDRHISLVGTIKSSEGKELSIEIQDVLETKEEVEKWAKFVNNITAPLKNLEKATLKVVDKKIALSGRINSAEEKELTVDILSRLESQEEAEKWSQFIVKITAPLSKLEKATLKVIDRNISVVGTIKSNEGKELSIEIQDVLETKEEVDKWAKFVNNITAPLNNLEKATLKVFDKKITLSGRINSVEGKKLTVDIVSTLKSKEEAEKWSQFIVKITAPLSKLEKATLTVVDRNISLVGIVRTTKDKIFFLKKYQLKGYKITSNIIAGDQKFVICQNKFNSFLKQEKITYASATAIIDFSSETLLLNLYRTAISCPNATINVIGHTDSLGQDDANQQLSYERAQSVVNRLLELGLNASRINAIGKGESSPIARNSTKEGREKNRRIEFKILGY
jgi:outer membrane protein OmpA-like peptidoglycan-associated protein/ABC-type amino acid transport substrate-binding protein